MNGGAGRLETVARYFELRLLEAVGGEDEHFLAGNLHDQLRIVEGPAIDQRRGPTERSGAWQSVSEIRNRFLAEDLQEVLQRRARRRTLPAGMRMFGAGDVRLRRIRIHHLAIQVPGRM